MKAAQYEAAAAVLLTACLGAAFLMLASPAEAAPAGQSPNAAQAEKPSTAAQAAQPSKEAVDEFKRLNPCPVAATAKRNCPGHVVAYVQPLCADGEDAAANLQWQTLAQRRDNERWVQQYCQFRRARAQGQASA